MTDPSIHVVADDRSGAMEAAALCADAGFDAWVVSWDGDHVDDRPGRCVVTDLRSRHVGAPEAALARLRTAITTYPGAAPAAESAMIWTGFSGYSAAQATLAASAIASAMPIRIKIPPALLSSLLRPKRLNRILRKNISESMATKPASTTMIVETSMSRLPM